MQASSFLWHYASLAVALLQNPACGRLLLVLKSDEHHATSTGSNRLLAAGGNHDIGKDSGCLSLGAAPEDPWEWVSRMIKILGLE